MYIFKWRFRDCNGFSNFVTVKYINRTDLLRCFCTCFYNGWMFKCQLLISKCGTGATIRTFRYEKNTINFSNTPSSYAAHHPHSCNALARNTLGLRRTAKENARRNNYITVCKRYRRKNGKRVSLRRWARGIRISEFHNTEIVFKK